MPALLNLFALRKAKIVYNVDLSECNKVKACLHNRSYILNRSS